MPRHKDPPAPEQLPPVVERLTTLVLPLAAAPDEVEALLDDPDYVPAFIRDAEDAATAEASLWGTDDWQAPTVGEPVSLVEDLMQAMPGQSREDIERFLDSN